MMRISPYINQGFVLINPRNAFGKITELKREIAGEPASGRIETVILQGGLTMLVLSRKRGEMITIGIGVTVTVLAVQGDRVKLGIVAPAEVPVHRQEIHERIGGCSPVLDYA
jgi:carbon storage regulator